MYHCLCVMAISQCITITTNVVQVKVIENKTWCKLYELTPQNNSVSSKTPTAGYGSTTEVQGSCQYQE